MGKMIIDIALSSCARVELLQNSVLSFIDSVVSEHTFRWVIVEDKVDDPDRQKEGKKWIQENKDFFDEIIFSERKLTYVFCFGEVLKYVNSKIFIRWEDDFEFQRDFDIDPMIETVQKHHKDYEPVNMANISFKRNYCDTSEYKQVGNNLLESPLFSIGPGVFNTKLTRDIVNLSGTGECHEFGVLTPSMNKLGYKSYIWGGKDEPFLLDHVGKKMGYNKGDYK